MLNYSPKQLLYPGDEKMRMVTVMRKSDRNKRQQPTDIISSSQFRAAKRSMNSRLCGDLDKLCYHAKCIQRLNKPRICAWCGLPTYSACGRCVDKNFKSIPLHYNAKKGKGKDSICFYQYHNDNCFGLGGNDKTQLLNGVKSDWIAPNNRDIRDNTNIVKTWN